MIKIGDILVAKDNYTTLETGAELKYRGDNSKICLTKDKHYEIILIFVDEVYITNDFGDKDFFNMDRNADDIHHWKSFFYTLKEFRQIKLKELGV
jgi:hypothetical protein